MSLRNRSSILAVRRGELGGGLGARGEGTPGQAAEPGLRNDNELRVVQHSVGDDVRAAPPDEDDENWVGPVS